MNSIQNPAKDITAVERAYHPLHRWFQRAYLCVACCFILCILCQVFLAGAGILVTGSWLKLHAVFGSFIILIPMLLLPLGLLGRLPRAMNWLNALLMILSLLQPLLLWLHPASLALMPALHPVNALLLFALPLYLSYRVWGLLRAKE